jgi:AcrR family transcriptional regulator
MGFNKLGTRERREREKEHRRNQILNAAKEIFMSKGLRAATMEDIAGKAELSPGTIYTYFKNKEELYAVLNLIGLQYLYEQNEKVYKNQKLSVEAKLIKFKDAMYETFVHDPLLLRVIFHVQLEDALFTLDKVLLEQLNHLAKRTMSFFVDTYEEGVRQGKFKKDQGIILSDIIWATFTGLVLWEEAKRKIDPRKTFLKPTLDKAFDIFTRGIKK